MGKTLYLECASGISGDMVVGALLDLGANEAGLRRALDSLQVDGFEIAVTRKQVSGIDACDFDVLLDEEHESHDHDMDFLYGNLDGAEGHGHHHHHHHHHEGDECHHHHEGDECHHHHEGDECHHHEEECHCHEEGQEPAEKDKKGKRRGRKHELKLKSRLEKRLRRKKGKGKKDAEDEATVLALVQEDEHVHAPVDGDVEAHEHEHHHVHDHDHHHHDHAHGHHHEHRSPADIAAIIDAADLAPRAKATAHRIFDIVAQAEAKAHGLPIEQVHFHEVGAVDSIVDVVSVAYCLDDLDVTDAYVSPLAEGRGRVRCAHGVLPVPVPAVTNIVADHGLVLEPRDVLGELVTPTGAAIAAAVRTMDAPPARYRVVKTGLGSGKRAYDPPSTVRALVIEEVAEAATPAPVPLPQSQTLGAPDLWKLETELDDCTGEALGNVAQLLYEAGALEVHFLPVYMKKNRPGYQIEVLCGESLIASLENVIFEHTTTIGIRRCPMWRTALQREQREVETSVGTLQVKVVTLPSGAQRAYPEHDSVTQLAAQAGVSYQDVLREAMAALA